jgi:hypothetical protein
MPKKYPWQRWPDKDKKKDKTNRGYHGQTRESSWKKSSMQTIKDNIKDEAKGSRTYRRLAKDAPTPEEESTLNTMADDEERHRKNLKQMDPPEDRTYLYSTIHRGKVKVTSEKQHRLLEGRGLPHTHVYRTESGKIVRKRVNT